MNQPSLFDAEPTWMQQRNHALAVVEKAANEQVPGFTERAREVVLDYLAKHGRASGEELTAACRAAGLVPNNDKAFGAIYGGLSRKKLIVKDGFCVRTKGHGTAGGIIWKLP